MRATTSADEPLIAQWPAEVRARYQKYEQAYDAGKAAAAPPARK